jgi:hypothetical protein
VIIKPIPVPPPVTTAVTCETSKSFELLRSSVLAFPGAMLDENLIAIALGRVDGWKDVLSVVDLARVLEKRRSIVEIERV